MKIDVTISRPAAEAPHRVEAVANLTVEPLRWGGVFVWPACDDGVVAQAAARLYAWYFGYLLYTNAALVRAQATRSVVEHSRGGDRVFMKIGLEDGAGAVVETVTVGIPVAAEADHPTEEASCLLRTHGLALLEAYADAPSQALALFGDRAFYTLPGWLDRALRTAQGLEAHALPPPAAADGDTAVPPATLRAG